MHLPSKKYWWYRKGDVPSQQYLKIVDWSINPKPHPAVRDQNRNSLDSRILIFFPLLSKCLLCCFFLSCSCIILMNSHNRLFQELTQIIFTHLVSSQHLKSDSKSSDSRLNHRPCCGVSPVRYSGSNQISLL